MFFIRSFKAFYSLLNILEINHLYSVSMFSIYLAMFFKFKIFFILNCFFDLLQTIYLSLNSFSWKMSFSYSPLVRFEILRCGLEMFPFLKGVNLELLRSKFISGFLNLCLDRFIILEDTFYSKPFILMVVL